MSTIRHKLAHDFLNRAGWGTAHVEPIQGDASFRSYARIIDKDRTAILMDAPPPQEDVRPFAALDYYLNSQGFSAPQIIASDADQGFLLLEDFGTQSFSRILKESPQREEQLYGAAVDVLVQLALEKPISALQGLDHHRHHLLPYDQRPLHTEAEFLFEWALPALSPNMMNSAARHHYLNLWQPHFQFLEQRLEVSPVLVLRDYHVDNLMWLDDRVGPQQVGLLDFQDALIGDQAYDLVSLLQDARRDVPIETEDHFLEKYMVDAQITDKDAFKKAYAVLGAHRSARIVGIFIRLWKRDNKPHYLIHLPRLWGYIERNLAHPALSDIKDWFDTHIGQEIRIKDPKELAS